MKMVIELEDDLYKRILDMKQPLFMNDLDSVYKAIVNGTPLPEHHGDLIDRDKLLTKSEWYGERFTYSNPMPNGESAVPEEVVLNAPTIIEGSDSE